MSNFVGKKFDNETVYGDNNNKDKIIHKDKNKVI